MDNNDHVMRSCPGSRDPPRHYLQQLSRPTSLRSIDIVLLTGILLRLESSNQVAGNDLRNFLTGFDTTALSGQNSSSLYFLAIAPATLLSIVPAIAEATAVHLRLSPWQ